MPSRYFAIALLACGCGEVAHPAGDAGDRPLDGATDGARLPDAAVATTYKGSTAQTAAAPFGGAPYCNYTITLKQLALDLDILPSGQVVAGHVKNLNVEGTDASCPNGVIPASLANYTLQSAVPGASGTSLTFLGASDNVPMVSLVGDLSRTSSAYSVVLSFHRTDQPPPLDWKVMVSLPMASL